MVFAGLRDGLAVHWMDVQYSPKSRAKRSTRARHRGGPCLGGVNTEYRSGRFPSPAEDHGSERVDLNKVLIKHPLATFLMRVRGASMREAGIDDGDVVLVDRAIRACHGHVVVAVVEGEFTVKRLWKRGSNLKLQAANPTYPDILPKDGQTVEVWGVVTNAIKAMQK